MRITRFLAGAVAVFGMGIFAPAALGLVALPMPPRPTPVAPPNYQYVWVAPVYQTVTEQTWVPESVQWVAEWREIAPGRYEQVWRQLVTPGYWRTSTRRVQVSAGHWELVAINPPPPWPPIIIDPPMVVRPPIVVRNPGTVGVEGFGRGGGEDLSKFSPLSEWPR